MAKFTQVRTDTWESIQINAGVLVSSFDPATGTYTKSNILGATNGGVSFNSNPEFVDYGEDIDNVPANTKQLKRIQSYNPELSGTFTVVDTALGKKLIAAADIDSQNDSHIIPRNSLTDADFGDIWLVGDYSTKNGNSNGGFVAVHVKNALSTGGFQWQTTKDGKGQFAFTFEGHYDLDNIDDIPFEMYVKDGSDEDITINITTQPSDVTVVASHAATFSVTAVSQNTIDYQWQVMTPSDTVYSDIEDAESATLTIAAADVTADANGNKYRCKLYDGTSRVFSRGVTLTVTAGV